MGILQDVFSPQDVLAPVNISLTYVYTGSGMMIPQHLEFPINPEELTKEIGSNSDSVNIEGLGEVSIPKTPSLSKISVKSFFWQQMNLMPSIAYVRWLQRWQKSKQPALLVVTRFDYSMWVTCENFNYTIRAGEENDIYFELELREYREYGAKTLATLNVSDEVKKRILESTEAIAEAMLVTIPPPTRIMRSAKEIVGLRGSSYICKASDSLLSICRKFDKTGEDDWKELYECSKENSKKISESFAKAFSFENIKLDIPQSWLNGANVINV